MIKLPKLYKKVMALLAPQCHQRTLEYDSLLLLAFSWTAAKATNARHVYEIRSQLKTVIAQMVVLLIKWILSVQS